MPRRPQSPEEALSRSLSRTLRHVAVQQGIPQDANGWCRLDDLLSKAPYTTTTREQIAAVVAADRKGRYEFSEDGERIRAVQGHTVNVDVEMTPVSAANLPPVLVHGTSETAWPAIRVEGLKRMKRMHIHLAQGLPGSDGVISGMRGSAKVRIYLDGSKLLANGVPLLLATNGAVLSPGVDGVIGPEYFLRVTDREGNPIS